MNKKSFLWLILIIFLILSGCRSAAENAKESATIALPNNLPVITSIGLNQGEIPNYERVEFLLAIEADYENPYNLQEISLEAFFNGPNGTEMVVPGFWDGEESWRIRFTPSQVGEWTYAVAVTDKNGTSQKTAGNFLVTPSDHHGWLQIGNWVNPTYSSHFLVHHDGTPFYGIGHAQALNILVDGFSIDHGVELFNNMVTAGENYVVWWPFYSNSPVNPNYDDYSVSNLNLIDMVVQDAHEKDIFLIFTVWDHPQLRDSTHNWGDGRWDGYNGFAKLSPLDEFFASYEAWLWQENLYRYIIARWGYSPAIGMWQTVSEINGTNAYCQSDLWHEKVNTYFTTNDPYRHPTTASMSGDVDWPQGHAVMDIPQVHVYSLDHEPQKDAVKAAVTIADWTALMWQTGKPNWIGEFGVQASKMYPELFHNSIWAALASGAAMTPAEWNSRGQWMQMTPEMYAAAGRLADFVADIPLAAWNPSQIEIDTNNVTVRAWGLAGDGGGLIWVQDFSQEGETIESVRKNGTTQTGVILSVQGIPSGDYQINSYNTWSGVFLDQVDIQCQSNDSCEILLPDFRYDMALKLVQK
jgi:hypothetical protein